MASGQTRRVITTLPAASVARYAIYYAPDPADPLWQAGCGWLGRDPLTDETLLQPALPGWSSAEWAALTASPRRYGFHATLKPPVRLNAGYDEKEFLAAVEALAGMIPVFPMPALSVTTLQGFLALTEQSASSALRALCDRCVIALDPFRAPPTDEELARRRQLPLSPAREAMLRQWGYPDVLDEWRFHMTLSEKLPASAIPAIQSAAEKHFSAALADIRLVDALCVYRQEAPDRNFSVLARFPLAKATQ
ncbi:Hypothetical protein GbCGDNIH9_1118 [Granulibacter bethesdensis]|uniref:Phosphonate metabolism protein n=1 Tax=Granulibacter bethesdensis TaxID=364410 RepID=A0AAC9KAW8_9PROT|nr:Hypothetical protein GbCGDNIH9_1118 [Granulibacter bethesdensis]APH61984.1 Hypothetical protein GbCGDNIH8_1118 [Granulibacter bethesdensis]